MFDLITDTSARPLRERSLLSKIVAIAVHSVIVGVVIMLPLLQATSQLPPVVPTIMAFIAEESATPPPPAPVARAPVRIGGQITAPALLKRVEPTYPEVAAIAHITGIVILEAVVDTEGCVESVKILRSRHALLDKASQEALLQWRYSPLVLNGIPTSFVLTVTFNFSTQ